MRNVFRVLFSSGIIFLSSLMRNPSCTSYRSSAIAYYRVPDERHISWLKTDHLSHLPWPHRDLIWAKMTLHFFSLPLQERTERVAACLSLFLHCRVNLKAQQIVTFFPSPKRKLTFMAWNKERNYYIGWLGTK